MLRYTHQQRQRQSQLRFLCDFPLSLNDHAWIEETNGELEGFSSRPTLTLSSELAKLHLFENRCTLRVDRMFSVGKSVEAALGVLVRKLPSSLVGVCKDFLYGNCADFFLQDLSEKKFLKNAPRLKGNTDFVDFLSIMKRYGSARFLVKYGNMIFEVNELSDETVYVVIDANLPRYGKRSDRSVSSLTWSASILHGFGLDASPSDRYKFHLAMQICAERLGVDCILDGGYRPVRGDMSRTKHELLCLCGKFYGQKYLGCNFFQRRDPIRMGKLRTLVQYTNELLPKVEVSNNIYRSVKVVPEYRYGRKLMNTFGDRNEADIRSMQASRKQQNIMVEAPMGGIVRFMSIAHRTEKYSTYWNRDKMDNPPLSYRYLHRGKDNDPVEKFYSVYKRTVFKERKKLYSRARTDTYRYMTTFEPPSEGPGRTKFYRMLHSLNEEEPMKNPGWYKSKVYVKEAPGVRSDLAAKANSMMFVDCLRLSGLMTRRTYLSVAESASIAYQIDRHIKIRPTYSDGHCYLKNRTIVQDFRS